MKNNKLIEMCRWLNRIVRAIIFVVGLGLIVTSLFDYTKETMLISTIRISAGASLMIVSLR